MSSLGIVNNNEYLGFLVITVRIVPGMLASGARLRGGLDLARLLGRQAGLDQLQLFHLVLVTNGFSDNVPWRERVRQAGETDRETDMRGIYRDK